MQAAEKETAHFQGGSMVGVQMSGGLGNQMFEYALYLKLRSMGKDVKMDDFTCYGPGERPKQLDVFGVSYDVLTKEEYNGLTDSWMQPWHRVRRKLSGRKDLSYREKSSNFDPEVLTKEPALLLGYFQSEKYFEDIKDQVREAFIFRNFSPSKQTRAYEKMIDTSFSVSVHIRRGDYLKAENIKQFGDICSDGYYERAIGRMKELFPQARFYIFSNDPEWTKKHFTGPEFVPVICNDEKSGYGDMYLMSKCRHHIIANSSFSWWGAWLNTNPDKKVIAPAKWFADRVCCDIYTQEMERL